ANGSAVGWQLAINVAAMLMAFVALIAMVNLGVTWMGHFFVSASGLVQFNLIALAVVISLGVAERYGPISNGWIWWGAVVVGAVYFAGRAAGGADAARLLTLIAAAGWLPLFAASVSGRRGFLGVLGIALAANIAYFIAGPLGSASTLTLQ